MFAPAINEVMATFQSTSPLLSSFAVSVWVLGYFFGPLFLGPLSEMYGRWPVYIATNILFTVFNIATAVSPSLSALIVFRFFAGTSGAGPLTVGSGTLGDLIKPENRGKMIAVWSVGPLLGPVLGPIAGGYLGENLGWRWICWILAILAGIGAIACILLQEETYPVTLIDRKVRRLREETGNSSLESVYYIDRKPSHVFSRSIMRPLRLFVFSPTVTALSLYQGIMFGFLYLLFTTFPLVFKQQYNFSTGNIGLTYLGSGIGSIISLVTTGLTLDMLAKRLAGTGAFKPEHRLPPLIPACFFIPIGLFWYGWTAENKAHWILPIFGTVFNGFGINTLIMLASTYLIDANPLYEASAIAACTAVRSLIGAFVPLAGRSMYEALGLGWGNSLLGFMALALCPLPWYFYKYGERIRTNPRFQVKM